MESFLWIIPAFPLVGFLLLLARGKKFGEPLAGWIAAACVFGAFVFSLATFVELLSKPAESRSMSRLLYCFVESGGFGVKIGILADPLSITMALFVTGIGTLIHVYAIGYMHGDERFSRFFVYLNLFVFSMLVLVLADNYFISFFGWEGVGVCSYFLISFWFERDAAAVAGKKAFVTNRIGDFGFMMAIFLMFAHLGTVKYTEVFARIGSLSGVTVTAICLMLFVGACGKSAQLPLYVWLPDAMEGPTPVSALIHAATMVTAGVYLMVRSSPLLALSADAPTVIAWVGGLTALFAATVAVAQHDIKRVLAYSTVSQLGYMFLAVGSGAYVAAIFHMVTHAFFKALLFLGAGSVIHGMHHEQDMRSMGALRKLMPVTAGTFIVGWLAIAGVPPFAGFWSKDEILLGAWETNKVLWAIGLFTALLTAYYMTRQVLMVFYGKARWDSKHPPHESPATMTGPLVVLSGLAIAGGMMNLPFAGLDSLARWLEPVLAGEHHSEVATNTKLLLAGAAVVCAVLAIAFAYRVVIKRTPTPESLEPLVLQNAWGVDAAYRNVIANPGLALSNGLASLDRSVIDGAVLGVGSLVGRASEEISKVQTGRVRQYATFMGLGAVGLLAWVVLRSVVG